MSEENQGDSVDFFGRLFKKKSKSEKKIVSQEPKAEVIVSVKGPIDSEEYTRYPKSGKCYIFNHKIFDDEEIAERTGTDEDCSALKDRFTELKFDVEVFPNFTVQRVTDKLAEAGKVVKHDDYTCFVCCILTHGAGDGFLYARDGPYPIKDVFEPFQGDKCHSLVDKPKLFFIQACRGDKFDGGVRCKESFDGIIKIPVEADFLIAQSTVPGYVAWRNGTGSWFIQSLCAVMKKFAEDKDILQMLTIVCRRVSFKCSNVPGKPEKHKKTQIPCITSTLRKDFKFT